MKIEIIIENNGSLNLFFVRNIGIIKIILRG